MYRRLIDREIIKRPAFDFDTMIVFFRQQKSLAKEHKITDEKAIRAIDVAKRTKEWRSYYLTNKQSCEPSDMKTNKMAIMLAHKNLLSQKSECKGKTECKV